MFGLIRQKKPNSKEASLASKRLVNKTKERYSGNKSLSEMSKGLPGNRKERRKSAMRIKKIMRAI